MIAERSDGQDGRGREGIHQSSLFYIDDGIITSSDPGWLQGDFSTLVGLFNWEVQRESVSNTVGMVCRPFQEAGTQLEAA